MSTNLFFAPRTRSTRPRWLLEELGVPYDLSRLDVAAGDNKKPAYLAVHPLGKLPGMTDDGHPMFESAAMILHLADKYADRGLAPKPGTPERAEYYQWILFCMASVELHLVQVGKLNIRKDRTAAEEQLLEDERRSAHEHLAVIDRALAGREFIVGSSFTAADVVVASTLAWARMMGALEGLLNCDAYATRQVARPAARKARES